MADYRTEDVYKRQQLAAMADTHFSVEKGERDGRTYTRVVLLDREQRKAELARITGGSRVTAVSYTHLGPGRRCLPG